MSTICKSYRSSMEKQCDIQQIDNYMVKWQYNVMK